MDRIFLKICFVAIGALAACLANTMFAGLVWQSQVSDERVVAFLETAPKKWAEFRRKISLSTAVEVLKEENSEKRGVFHNKNVQFADKALRYHEASLIQRKPTKAFEDRVLGKEGSSVVTIANQFYFASLEKQPEMDWYSRDLRPIGVLSAWSPSDFDRETDRTAEWYVQQLYGRDERLKYSSAIEFEDFLEKHQSLIKSVESRRDDVFGEIARVTVVGEVTPSGRPAYKVSGELDFLIDHYYLPLSYKVRFSQGADDRVVSSRCEYGNFEKLRIDSPYTIYVEHSAGDGTTVRVRPLDTAESNALKKMCYVSGFGLQEPDFARTGFSYWQIGLLAAGLVVAVLLIGRRFAKKRA